METQADISNAFAASDLFRGTDPSSVRGGFVLSFRRGQEISETQRGIECLGVVISGCLGVEASEGGSVSVTRRGGEFGICNIFVREKMPTRLWARTQSRVLFIPKDEFARLLGADPALMYRYVKLCNEKMIYLADRLRLISVSDHTERLYRYILTRAENGVAEIGIPKDELARQLRISRSSLFRALKSLEEDGRISVSANTVTVLPKAQQAAPQKGDPKNFDHQRKD